MHVDFEALITLTTEKSIPVLSIIEGIEPVSYTHLTLPTSDLV